jgi:hypothetical protein
VLLIGPTSTMGLGIPDASQTTSTVQGAVQTTQQTASTVTNVPAAAESTVQTVEQTAMQVAPPQPAAPASAPSSAPAAADAPKQAGTRVATPVTKHVASAPAPRTAIIRSTSGTHAVAQASDTVRQAAATLSTHTQKVPAAKHLRSRSSTPAEADAPALQCELSLVEAVPGAAELSALLNLICSAAGDLIGPARLGLDPPPAADASRGVALGNSGVPAISQRSRARSAGVPVGRAGHAQVGGDINASAASQLGGTGAPTPPVAAGRAGGLGYIAAATAAKVTPASAHSGEGTSSGHEGRGWFGGQSAGTVILLAFLALDMALIAGVVARRLAVRWALRPIA